MGGNFYPMPSLLDNVISYPCCENGKQQDLREKPGHMQFLLANESQQALSPRLL